MENSRAINKNDLNIDVKADGQIKIIVNNETMLNVDAAKNLYGMLKPIFEKQQNQEPELPEEPEEAGLYVSQQGHVLTKYRGNWTYADPILTLSDGKAWSNDARYTSNWEIVVKDLGEDAFPLMHITKSDVIALAQSKSESEE